MLAQLSVNRAGFLSKFSDKGCNRQQKLALSKLPVWRASSGHNANLLQSKVSYG
jgi:hypothetical protein